MWYNACMTEIQEFIKKRPHLIWYVKDYEHLGEESIVEHVLNYGDWNDFQEMIRIMGIERAAAPDFTASPMRRFSSTVRRLKISLPCGTKPMPSAARVCGAKAVISVF